MERRLSRQRNPRTQILVVSIVVLSIYAIATYLGWTLNLDLKFGFLDIVKGLIKLPLGFFFPRYWMSIPRGVWILFADLGLMFAAVFLFWLAFFAQFVMPVRSLIQRLMAFRYLIHYLPGGKTLAIKIEDGKIVQTEPAKLKRRGPGVILLDTASAGVLRRAESFTRSIGPGLVFTRAGEYLADTVDLHPQVWPLPTTALGPRGEENPFEGQRKVADRDPKEIEKAKKDYEERQKRRSETSGFTRDGVEIVPQVFAVFRLDPDLQPKWNGEPHVETEQEHWDELATSHMETQFKYSPEAVRRAITGESINPRASKVEPEERKIPWNKLPVYVAVDLWREYLRKFTFSQLFLPLEEDEAYRDAEYQGMTALQVIQKMISARLTKPIVDEIDPVGRLGRDPAGREAIDTDGEPVRDEHGNPIHIRQMRSHEYEVMQSRGIKVFASPIRNPQFPAAVEQKLVDSWFAYWLYRAKSEQDYVARLRAYKAHAGELDALQEFATFAASQFEDDFIQSTLPLGASGQQAARMRTTLEQLLEGTLKQCLRDTQLHQRLAGEEAHLNAMLDWLRGRAP